MPPGEPSALPPGAAQGEQRGGHRRASRAGERVPPERGRREAGAQPGTHKGTRGAGVCLGPLCALLGGGGDAHEAGSLGLPPSPSCSHSSHASSVS